MNKNLKKYIGYSVLVLTIIIFGYYIRNNPGIIDQLKSTNINTIILTVFLYSLMTIVLIYMSKVILKMSGLHLPDKENALLTMYSSVINFFGPLQSGPGFRVVYLKKKHGFKVKKYLLVSIVYYILLATFSGLIVLSGIFSLLISLVLAMLSVGFIIFVLPTIVSLIKIKGYSIPAYSKSNIFNLSFLTLLQFVLISTIYFIELKSVDSSVNYGQALIYGGAANFSLFVSLTPGALGFRESFLFFTQKLHEIQTDTIIAASILDRAIFVLFLGLMMLFIMLIHGREFLSKAASKSAPSDL